jgi:hypothetical protein
MKKATWCLTLLMCLLLITAVGGCTKKSGVSTPDVSQGGPSDSQARDADLQKDLSNMFWHGMESMDIEAVRKAILLGLDVKNNLYQREETPLATTCGRFSVTGSRAQQWANDRLAVARLLITKGADVNARDLSHGRTPLFGAVADDRTIAITRLLIEKGADVNAKDRISWTPLHAACESGAQATVKFLLESGADKSLSVKTAIGKETPADIARKYGHTEILKLLP